MAERTCASCGAVATATAVSCSACGQPLRSATGAEPSGGESRPPPPTAGQPGWPPSSQTPAPPVGGGVSPARKSTKWPFLLAGVVVVAALVAGGLVWANRDKGPAHPSAWDPRVAPIANWVANKRGLAYKEPVFVDFLSPAQYTKRAGGGNDGTGGSSASKKQRQDELDRQLGELRALGLVEGKVDLKKATTDLNDSGTLAYYSPREERIFVRGTAMTPGLKVTLAHELTHVLQDQHFDLKRLDKLPSTQRTALRSLAEGDARRIEHLYVKSLSSSDRKRYQDAEAKDSKNALTKLDKSVPPALIALFGAPYDFGTEFVDLLDHQGGNTAIDKAFENAPKSDEQLFDPFTYLDHDGPKDVKAPPVPKGTKQLDNDSLGATVWYLILATRVDPKVALAAADGWGGDRYVEYRRKSTVCIADRFEGDTAKDTDEMGKALAQLPEKLVSMKRQGGALVVTFCDPGQNNKLGIPNVATQVIGLPVLRSQISISALAGGANRKQSQCYAEALVNRLDVAQLTGSTVTPEVQQAVTDARRRCV